MSVHGWSNEEIEKTRKNVLYVINRKREEVKIEPEDKILTKQMSINISLRRKELIKWINNIEKVKSKTQKHRLALYAYKSELKQINDNLFKDIHALEFESDFSN